MICAENHDFVGQASFTYNGVTCEKELSVSLAWVEYTDFTVPNKLNTLSLENHDTQTLIEEYGLTAFDIHDQTIFTRIHHNNFNGIKQYDLNGNDIRTSHYLKFFGLGNIIVDSEHNYIYNSSELIDYVLANYLDGDGSDSGDAHHVIYDPVAERCKNNCRPWGIAVGMDRMYFGVASDPSLSNDEAAIFSATRGVDSTQDRQAIVNQSSGLLFISEQDSIKNVIFDEENSRIFWNTASAIQSIDLTGSNLITHFHDESIQVHSREVFGLAIHGDNIYFSRDNHLYMLPIGADESVTPSLIHSTEGSIITLGTLEK